MEPIILAEETTKTAAPIVSPGEILENARKKKNLTREFVSGKLYLRTQVIEHLENDTFDMLPDAVFVRGYLRAYAKLLGIDPEALINAYNFSFSTDDVNKSGSAIWQAKRSVYPAEKAIKVATITFGFIVLLATILWWHKGSESKAIISETVTQPSTSVDESDVKHADLSKMRSLLNSDTLDAKNDK